jgi:hypothetical protein
LARNNHISPVLSSIVSFTFSVGVVLRPAILA